MLETINISDQLGLLVNTPAFFLLCVFAAFCWFAALLLCLFLTATFDGHPFVAVAFTFCNWLRITFGQL